METKYIRFWMSFHESTTHLSTSGKLFVAQGTRIGLLAGVESHVEAQAFLKGEGLGALGAGKLFAVLVGRGDMVLQVDRLPVALPADGALVRPLVRVNEHVALQVRFAAKLLGTEAADVVLPFHGLWLSADSFLRRRLDVVGIFQVLLTSTFFLVLVRTGVPQTSQAALPPLDGRCCDKNRGRASIRRRRGERDPAVCVQGDGILFGQTATTTYHFGFNGYLAVTTIFMFLKISSLGTSTTVDCFTSTINDLSNFWFRFATLRIVAIHLWFLISLDGLEES